MNGSFIAGQVVSFTYHHFKIEFQLKPPPQGPQLKFAVFFHILPSIFTAHRECRSEFQILKHFLIKPILNDFETHVYNW